MNLTQNRPEDLSTGLVLRGAATYLKLFGWNQGDYYGPRPTTDKTYPPACVLGAIGVAAYDEIHTYPEDETLPGFEQFERAVNVLRRYLFGETRVHTVGDWNDRPTRTADEVIAALNAAADGWYRANEPTHTTPTDDSWRH